MLRKLNKFKTVLYAKKDFKNWILNIKPITYTKPKITIKNKKILDKKNKEEHRLEIK